MISNCKKNVLRAILLLFFVSVFYVYTPTPQKTFAEVGVGLDKEYVPLAPLPDKYFPGTAETKYLLPNYLSGLFKILIAVAGLLSVVMIVIGGIEYMSTDAMYGKSEGKQRITNAVLGLLLALVSWLVLYSINPKLLEFNLNAVTPIKNTGDTAAPIIDSPVQNLNPGTNRTLPDTTIQENQSGVMLDS